MEPIIGIEPMTYSLRVMRILLKINKLYKSGVEIVGELCYIKITQK